MNSNKDSKGFGAADILTILALITVLWVGYQYIKNNKQSSHKPVLYDSSEDCEAITHKTCIHPFCASDCQFTKAELNKWLPKESLPSTDNFKF